MATETSTWRVLTDDGVHVADLPAGSGQTGKVCFPARVPERDGSVRGLGEVVLRVDRWVTPGAPPETVYRVSQDDFDELVRIRFLGPGGWPLRDGPARVLRAS